MLTSNPLYSIVEYVENLEHAIDDLTTENASLKDNVASLSKDYNTLTIVKTALEAQMAELTSHILPDWEQKADKIILAGLYAAQLKIPYKFGAEYENDKAFDCSSFMQSIFKSQGITLPRTSASQSSVGTLVGLQDARKGDLLFFDTNNDGVINHVGVYVGNGKMLHTNDPKLPIRIQDIAGTWASRFVTARRVF
jgi:cell wall-associated NlpC family hydrolase